MNGPGRKSSELALIIFARLPQPGRVKTRLAATLGDNFAVAFYRLCTERIIRQTEQLPAGIARYVFHTGEEEAGEMQQWLGRGLHYVAQDQGNLGRRMVHAFGETFAGGAGRVVIIGTDIPDLSAALIEQAFTALETHDVVLGPAEDGGYYLIGLSEVRPELFQEIAWSTERVLTQTLQRVEQSGLSVFQLPTLADIDTEADLRRWVAKERELSPLFRRLVKDYRLL